MKTFNIAAFVLSGLLAALAGFAPRVYAQEKPANLPSDVIEFVGRRAACFEWSQKAFNPEVATQLGNIMNIMQSLKCGEIANDESLLRQRYAGEPIILATLKPTWVKIVKRLPVQTPVPPDPGR